MHYAWVKNNSENHDWSAHLQLKLILRETGWAAFVRQLWLETLNLWVRCSITSWISLILRREQLKLLTWEHTERTSIMFVNQ